MSLVKTAVFVVYDDRNLLKKRCCNYIWGFVQRKCKPQVNLLLFHELVDFRGMFRLQEEPDLRVLFHEILIQFYSLQKNHRGDMV